MVHRIAGKDRKTVIRSGSTGQIRTSLPDEDTSQPAVDDGRVPVVVCSSHDLWVCIEVVMGLALADDLVDIGIHSSVVTPVVCESNDEPDVIGFRCSNNVVEVPRPVGPELMVGVLPFQS